MEPDKDVISIYKDNSNLVLTVLTDEQAGQLFKAILKYCIDGSKTEFKDPLVNEVFSMYVKGIDRLDAKYVKRRDANRRNGLKGGRPTKKAFENPSKPIETHGINSETQTKANEKNPSSTSTSTSASTSTDTSTDTSNKYNKTITEEYNTLIPDTWEQIWNTYPYKEGKDRACREYIRRIQEGWEPGQLLQAAAHYSEYCRAKETEKRYIMRPWNFFGSDKPFTSYIEQMEAEDDESSGENWRYNNMRADFFD